jgi:signal peptidase I
MIEIRQKFEALLKKIEAKRTDFDKKVSLWEEKNRKKFLRRGREVLASIKKVPGEIKSLLDSEKPESHRDDIKLKIKELKQAYKFMYESTKSEIRQWVEAILIAGTVALVLRTWIFGLYHVPTGSAERTVLVGDRVWGNKMAYYNEKPKHGDLVIFDNPEFIYDDANPVQKLWQKYIGLPIPLLGLRAGPVNVVKRLIACPGDWIEGRLEDGKPVIYLNGKKLNEPYVNPYPLKLVRRAVGILPFNLPFLPSFLRRTYQTRRYTYVPDLSYEQQPYYHMSENEIVYVSPHYDRITNWPYTPSIKRTGVIADIFGPLKVPAGKYWMMGDSRKNSQDSRWFGPVDESLIHGRLSFIIYSVDSEEPLWIFELLKHPIDFWTKSVRWNRFFKKPLFSK